MILLKSPLRISLLGGGTDFKSFYSRYSGSFLAFTINKYIYTFINDNPNFFGQRYRFSYSSSESVNEIKEIKNNIIRESLILKKYKSPFHLTTVSDIPHGNGLGSSSSFASSVLLGIDILKNKKNIDNKKLAYETCDLEINKIKSPIGIQDQFATALGGFNYHKIHKNGKILTFSLNKQKKLINDIQNKSALILIPNEKIDRKLILNQQRKNNYTQENIKLLKIMKKLSDNFYEYTKCNESLYEELIKKVNTSWECKKGLTKNISNNLIDSIFQDIKKQHLSIGHKILGAGGKGCAIIFFKSKKNRDNFLETYKKYKSMSFKLSFNGVENITL